jgi:hypothetical protein
LTHIPDEAKAATEAELFDTAEALHTYLVAAAIEHLAACAETIEDRARVVQIVRCAEAASLARCKALQTNEALTRGQEVPQALSDGVLDA